tara:strand:- start:720 stop:1148 length:429 start_codon:yes stop_codon:yes gene_type:complete
MKIAIGGDHAGFSYKKKIIEYLNSNGITILDVGPKNEASCDYPDFSHLVAKSVQKKEVDFGVLVCGSANGVAMAANKHNNIRAAICWNSEIASLAKTHNNANIICFPARFVSLDSVLRMIEVFIKKNFEGGRHLNRIKKIDI